MFVGSVNLENGTGLELVIIPLNGSVLSGQWKANTDLLMLCVVQDGRCCTCRPTDHPSRFAKKLSLQMDDAEHLAAWLKSTFAQ
jgi:hypothetical protein